MPVPTTRGAAKAPVPVAGYEAAALDELLARHLGRLEREFRLIESLGTRLDTALRTLGVTDGAIGDGTPSGAVEALTAWYERMARAGRQVVQGLDELTRLRSFLAGGPDSRPDLASRGEHEVLQFLTAAVAKLGLRLLPMIDVTPPPAADGARRALAS